MTEIPKEPDPPARKPRIEIATKGQVIRLVAIVAFIVGGIVYTHLSGAPQIAEVNDCMTGATAEELKVVECSDPAATLRVAARVEDKDEEQWSADEGRSTCSPFSDSGQSFWEGREGGKGYVLCLEPIR